MRKKILMIIVALTMTLSGYAQFEVGKKYVGASLSGLNLSYNENTDFTFGVQAKGGYLFHENWMILGQASYSKQTDVPANIDLGAGMRYYFVQNGIYAGMTANYFHSDHFDDIRPCVHVGYAFFINGCVTIEPEIYYNHSFKNQSDYSSFGFRIGLGIYL